MKRENKALLFWKQCIGLINWAQMLRTMHILVFNPLGSSHKWARIILPCQHKLLISNNLTSNSIIYCKRNFNKSKRGIYIYIYEIFLVVNKLKVRAPWVKPWNRSANYDIISSEMTDTRRHIAHNWHNNEQNIWFFQ